MVLAWSAIALVIAPGVRPSLPPWGSAEAGRGITHLLEVEAWGLFPTLGNAAKLAWLYALSGSDSESERLARRALERDELPADMHHLLAQAAALRGDGVGAVAEWRRAIAVRPDLPEAYLALGIFMAQGGDLLAGKEVFDRGAAAVRDSPHLFYNAALVRALSGQPEASIELFERALILDPEYREARENLAGVLASLGRFGESVEHYRKALEQAPGDARTRVLLARALLGLGERGEAARELRRALELDRTNAEARDLLDDLSGEGLPEGGQSLFPF